MRYIQNMSMDEFLKKTHNLAYLAERVEMAEYPDQNNYVTQAPDSGSSDESFTIDSKRKNLMREREYCARRFERLAVEKTSLENRRRELIFLMDAEEALITGINQALSTMDNYDQTDCAEQAPTENMPVSAAYDKNRGRGW